MSNYPEKTRLTSWAYLGNALLNSPLFSLYTLIAFILCKELGASPLQITLIVAIKPIAAIPSFYWSSFFGHKKTRVKTGLIAATLIGIVPTLLFPWIDNTWWYILSFGAFFFAERATIPAWMELLKVQLSENETRKAVSSSSFVNFLAASLVPLLISPILDRSIGAWKWFFVLAAFVSLLRLLLLARTRMETKLYHEKKKSSSHFLTHPWREGFTLLKTRPDFAFYQLIFFFGGLGLMVTQPALPKFIEGVLQLSYTEVALAIALCKGVGFALTNSWWSRWIYKIDLYRFSAIVTIVASASLFLLFASTYWTWGIYLSFAIYGVMQAGSQLSWQLAGPLFAKSEDSTSYSGVNVFMVGIRGLIGPWLGRMIWLFAGLNAPFYAGAIICLMGTAFGWLGYRLFEARKVEIIAN
ncbi:MAG: MFS transporter [Verrucomicrobia bacterium]|nr:MFS transporter [Verrucomicrobiota bacterium]